MILHCSWWPAFPHKVSSQWFDWIGLARLTQTCVTKGQPLGERHENNPYFSSNNQFDFFDLWRFSTAWYGTVRYGTVHFCGVFHWVLYLVPDTFLVPLRSRFHASRTVTKTWRVNSADHWLAWENRHYCVTELATRDPPLQSYPLDLNQHSQRRIGRNFCLNKRTFLHQPQNSSVVVCWGSSDVPLVDSRGADPARAWWCEAEGKSLMYNVTFELAIFTEYVFCLYFYLCICVLLQLKSIWSNKCTSRLY